MRAVFRPILPSVFLVAEGPIRTTGDERDAPAVAPIATVWAASWHMGFSPEADAAAAAVPCLDLNAALIDEHRGKASDTRDADEATPSPASLDRHDPGHLGEKGVVRTDPNVLAGPEAGAALPDQNAACWHCLP
jgi:hypothetical protein